MTHKRVTVTWVDVCSSHGWEGVDESARLDPVVCYTTGYLLRSDDTAVVVASTTSVGTGHAETNCRMSIPRSCIQSIEELA